MSGLTTCVFLLGVATAAPEGMIHIPGGKFTMGNDHGAYQDEAPTHEVELSPFYLDAVEVTNHQFAHFVEDTGYVTQAERDGFAWAFVPGVQEFQSIRGANWRHPNGPETSIAGKGDHPVVCVSWEDAQAFAEWAEKRLPTEAEWEYAARVGQATHVVASADGLQKGSDRRDKASEDTPDVRLISANFWQGGFPDTNDEIDGHYYTAPVASFEPNEWGVHDMIGNVWEWCADWYGADYYSQSAKRDPQGPEEGEKRVARGGSWFCSTEYCGAYNSHFRGVTPPTGAFSNMGFRCAKDVDPAKEDQS